MTAPAIYQDVNGVWFWRCEICTSFDGGFLDLAEAHEALERHRERHK